MNEELKKQLLEYGALVDDTVRRFMGDEALYERFVIKFMGDENCQRLNEHLDNGDYAEAFKDVHTLKGVAANLGLAPMEKTLVELTELLRDKTADEIEKAQVAAAREEFAKQYASFISIIEKYV